MNHPLRRTLPERHVQGLHDQLRTQVTGHGPTHDAAAPGVPGPRPDTESQTPSARRCRVGPQRPVRLATSGFLRSALRTGRATLAASGSPRVHADEWRLSGHRSLVQLRLHSSYPGLGLFEVGPRCADVHRRPPWYISLLRTRWGPSPCDRLSRPRTTTTPPPPPSASAGDEPSRRSARSGPGWGRWEGSHVPCSTVRQGRCPTMPLRYRHGYAAVLPRGLPAGDIDRRGSFHHHSGASAHRNPAQIRQVRAGGSLKGRFTLVPCVHLPVPLAGPGPSDGAGLSRLCQAACRLLPRPLGSGCPQLRQPAATD